MQTDLRDTPAVPEAQTTLTMPDQSVADGAAGLDLPTILALLRSRWRLLAVAPLAVGAIAFGATFLIAPTFTSKVTFLPPQQQSSAAASMLAALGPLAGLAGANTGGGRNTGDQYVALMQSVTVSDRLIERFKLQEVYDSKLRMDARKTLLGNVRILLGKKDGLISVEVDDTSPERAAAIANHYVDELRRVTSTLAVTEAQQRRMFFEQQLKQSRESLVVAQRALQSSGFNADALKAEPKAAADSYARLRAETRAAEVRMQVMRGTLTDTSPEVRQQQATLDALRAQLARLERATESANGPDYIGAYREFKYQEVLFDLYARQFELARVDESREGALIQVVDSATPAERKSAPRRGVTAAAATLIAALALTGWLLLRQTLRPGHAGTRK